MMGASGIIDGGVMERTVIHKKTFCKDLGSLIKTQVDAMRKKNPELDRKIKAYEATVARVASRGNAV